MNAAFRSFSASLTILYNVLLLSDKRYTGNRRGAVPVPSADISEQQNRRRSRSPGSQATCDQRQLYSLARYERRTERPATVLRFGTSLSENLLAQGKQRHFTNRRIDLSVSITFPLLSVTLPTGDSLLQRKHSENFVDPQGRSWHLLLRG